MRVTNRMMTNNTLRYIQDNIERLDLLRTQAASTKKFQKASDDPAAASASLSLRSSIAANQAYIDTAHTSDEWMDTNAMALGNLQDLAMRSINLAQSGMSDILDPTSLLALQTEFESMLNQAVDLANTQYKSDYIFAGTSIQTQPFSLTGPPFVVTPNGDTNEIIRNLGPGESVTVNIDGPAAFTLYFNALINGINAADTSDLETVASELQNAFDTINQSRTVNGVHQRQVQSAIKQGEETDYSLQSLLSQNEDVSLVEAITHLQQQEVAFQTVLEVSSRTLASMNLFDLM